MPNVVQFASKSARAVSRSRKDAIAVIIPRLVELLNGPHYAFEVSGRNSKQVNVNTLRIVATTVGSELVFRIDRDNRLVMSGAINSTSPDFSVGGLNVAVATWRRWGWESELF